MKLVWASLTFIVVLVTFVSPVSAETPENEVVRVRLFSESGPLRLEGEGLQFQDLTETFKPVALPAKGVAEIRSLQRNGRSFWSVRLNNKDPEQIHTEKYLLVRGQHLRAGSHALPSRVLLSRSGSQTDVVGVMPLDEYLVGVLASEMPLSWPLETLKAQAVAARSYALAVMRERRDKAYHLESSVLDQVFRHVVASDQSPLVRKAREAVAATKGLRLYGPREKVLKAFYHADCGGKTTTAQNVWKHGVNSGVVVDSSCPTNPRGKWRLELTRRDLLKRLNVQDFTELKIERNPVDRRVQGVRVAFNGESEKWIPANDFRQALGFQDLRSAMFEVRQEGEKFLFEGQGFGHGVGLCQWGSRTLGQKGYNFRQILKHYYPLASLK